MHDTILKQLGTTLSDSQINPSMHATNRLKVQFRISLISG